MGGKNTHKNVVARKHKPGDGKKHDSKFRRPPKKYPGNNLKKKTGFDTTNEHP